MKGAILSGLLFILVSLADVSPYSVNPGPLDDVILREMVARMGNDLVDYRDDSSPRMSGMPVGIIARGGMPATASPLDYDQFALSPSLRDREYLAHSTLFGKNIQNFEEGKPISDIKTDGVLPAYCTPPNPCPIGYSSKDGCLEEFENTAAFSRNYQSMQECMCDTEHMFNCPDSTRESEITALSRSINNDGSLDRTFSKLIEEMELENERVVAKKFHEKKSVNPYLQGERLPIAAKKGGGW